MLRNNTRPPQFILPDDRGRARSLVELADGKPLLLFFFRFAECPTSRRDLAHYAEQYRRIESLDARIVAISTDTTDRLRRLRLELHLPFPLLSDVDFAVSREWGIYESDETDEGPQPHGEPAVFLLQSDGTLAYSQIQSGPKGTANPAEMTLVLLYMTRNGGKYW
jgi:peroxiredoxin